MEENSISIREVLSALKKRWYLIVCITIITTVTAGVISMYLIKPTYQVSTKIFVGKPPEQTQIETSADIATYQKLMKTYSEIIKTKDLIGKALSLSESTLSINDVHSNLTVTPITDTQLLDVSYTGENPDEIKSVLESITKVFMDESNKLVTIAQPTVLEKVEAPENPIKPNKKLNVGVAFMLGIMLGVGLIMLLELLEDTFRSKEQIEKELNISVLAIIPDGKEK